MARLRAVLLLLRVFAFVSVGLLLAPNSQCQILNVGDDTSTPVEGAGHDYIKMLSETVNPANGSLSFRIQAPVAKGRGITVPFSFNYDSNGINHLVAGPYGAGTCCSLPWDEWFSSNDYLSQGGWSYGLPLAGGSYFNLTCPSGLSESDTSNYIFQDPSGGRHSLFLASNDGQCGNPIYATGGDSRYYASLVGECSGCHIFNPPITVSDADGTTFYFSSPLAHPDGGLTAHGSSLPNYIEDRNGNQATVYDAALHGGAAGAFTITDSVGRAEISSSGFGPSGSTNTLTFSGSTYKIAWETVSGAYTVSASPVNVENGVTCAGVPTTVSGNETVVSSITLPNNKTYNFYYNTWGLIQEIDYPTGGWVKYTWKMSDQLSDFMVFDGYYYNTTTKLYTFYPNACQYHYSVPVVSTRSVGFGGSSIPAETQTFKYATSWNGAGTAWNTKTTTVQTTDAVMNNTFQTTYNYAYTELFSMPPPYGNAWPSLIPVESSVQYYNWSNTSSPTRTVNKTWLDMYDISSEQTVLNDDNNLTSQTTYSYQFAGNTETGSVLSQLTQESEYDYGLSLLRKTVNNYQTFSATPLGGVIADKPCQTLVYDGSSNRYAETDYFYDNGSTTAVCGKAGTPSVAGVSSLVTGTHDETNYGPSSTAPRGNLTTVTKQCFQGSTACTTGNATSTYAYDETGQVLSVTDPCGNGTCGDMTRTTHTTNYSYANSYTVLSGGSNIGYIPTGNTNAYPTKITNPLGYFESFTYDYYTGQLTVSTDENTQSTKYLYNDLFSRPTQVNYPDTGQTQLAYNDSPYNSSLTAPSPSVTTTKAISSSLNEVSTVAFDGMGHKVETILSSDPDDATYVVSTYDGTGKPHMVYNPTRCNPPTTNCSEATWGTTTYGYDALGRTLSVTNPDGSVASTSYTGRAADSSDEGNGTRSVQRISQIDGLGRLTSVCEVTSTALGGITGTPAACGLDISATGFLTSYAYDALNNLTGVTQGGLNPRAFSYDSLSRLTKAQNPESGTVNYTYDANGNLATRAAPTATTTYTYDALNRITAKTYTGSTPAAYFYYDESSDWGQTLTNTVGRLTREQADGGLANAVFSYDAMGRTVGELECTPLNCSGGSFSKLTYAYDKLGDLTAHSNTTDNITFTNSYDAAARLTQIQRNFTDSQHPATQISFVSFTPFGAPLQANLGNGIDEYFVYSKRKQLMGMNQSPLGSGLFAFNIINPSNGSNGYAPNGNILYGNDTAIGLWAYTYDDMNRLVKGVCGNGGACSLQTTGFQYSYDRFGNRLQETVTGTGTQPSYSFDANNHITSSSGVVYDAAGHVTNDGLGTSYTYDAEDRITSVAGINAASYVYDAEGHRVRATVNGQIRDFIFDLSGRTIAQLTAGAWTRSEVYAGNSHVASFTSSATQFDYSDWLGTFRMRADVSGNWLETCSSLPFGEDLTCTGSADITPIHFTGKERDAESGLDNFEARYLGSSLGRFMSPDPMGGDTKDPQSLNRYAYVRNNPLKLTDPTGLNFNLGCSGPDTATCQGGLQGTTTTTTTTDANGNQTTTSTFTATEISNDKNGNLVDQSGNQYSGTFDGTNVSFTQNGSTQSSTGVWKEGSDPTSGITGGGALDDSFHFTFAQHGTGQKLNAFGYHVGSPEDAIRKLGAAGIRFSMLDTIFNLREMVDHPGALNFRSSGDPGTGANSTHLLLDRTPSATVPWAQTFNLHTGETNPTVSGQSFLQHIGNEQ